MSPCGFTEPMFGLISQFVAFLEVQLRVAVFPF